MLHNTIVSGGSSGGSSDYPIIYSLANAPVVANADFYEDTGLTFGSSSANGVTKAWTIMGDFQTVATYVTAFGINSSSSNGLTLYYNGASSPIPYFCVNNWSPTCTYKNNRCRIVITHDAGATTQATYYSLSNGEAVATTAAKSYGSLNYEGFAGNLYLGGSTAANFVGRIRSFTIYEGIVDSETIEEFLLPEDFIDWEAFATRGLPVGSANLVSSVTTIGAYTFYGRTGITSVSGSAVTSIGNYAFYGCTALESINFPALTSLSGAYCFQGCSALTSISMPNLQTLTSGGTGCHFSGVGGITLHLPELASNTGNYGFREIGSSTSKATIVLPKIQTLSASAFRASYLEAVDLGPNLDTLPSSCFYQGTGTTLILRRTTGVVAAASSDTLSNWNSSFTVYCPADLISQYQVETNWATKYDAGLITFVALEGSQYENYYADGTAIT